MAISERSKRIKYLEGIDRISSLPEPLLSRILSLLPTKYAVATSLLSRRWKFLWTSITNLEFDDEDTQQRYPTLDKKFTLFVNRVLIILKSPCIQNFQLKNRHQLCDPRYLESWICEAMERTVQKLELHLEMARTVELPLTHYYCETLTVMKLKGDMHFRIPRAASISFPNLHTLRLSRIKLTIASECSLSFPNVKDLVLSSVRYTNQESVHKLLASCSVLENLTIKRSYQDKVFSLIISVPSLISLTLRFWRHESSWQSKLHMDTPALKYLVVKGDSMCCFTSENLSSLCEASIKLKYSSVSTLSADGYCNDFIKFIGGLSNVTFLSVSGKLFEAHCSSPKTIVPVFCNLTELEFSSYSCWFWSVVVKNFLESMHNLKHLVLKLSRDGCKSRRWWLEPKRVPVCLLHSVQTIFISDVVLNCYDEVKLVRYFLMNGNVLKKLIVDRIRGTTDERLKCRKELKMVPKGSKECIVHVGYGM